VNNTLNPVSSRLKPIKPSASAWVSQAAKVLKAEGHDVIDMGLGEPDFLMRLMRQHNLGRLATLQLGGLLS